MVKLRSLFHHSVDKLKRFLKTLEDKTESIFKLIKGEYESFLKSSEQARTTKDQQIKAHQKEFQSQISFKFKEEKMLEKQFHERAT